MPDLTQYMWLIWLGLILIFVTIELLTLEFTFLMLGVGSLGGLGANLLGAPWWEQILVALVLSVLLLWLIRPVMLRYARRGADPTPSNIDALYGMEGRVVTPVTDIGGQVRLANGETWTALLAEPSPTTEVPVGATVSVTAIRGATAIVTPTGRT